MLKSCVIIGLGNIGKIHAKYLSKNNIPWYWYDIANNGPQHNKVDINDIVKFDRVLIASPEHCHHMHYKQVRDAGYNGYIFIEKPAAINKEHINEILSDNKVIVGMVERFNPAIQTLKQSIDKNKIINIDFSRCCLSTQTSRISIFEDIGIHDIDLLFFLLDLQSIEKHIIHKYKNTVVFTSLDPLVRMIWSKDTFFKERKIIVRQTDCTFEVDLQEQCVVAHLESSGYHVSKSLFVEKSSPIENELRNFMSDKPSHIDCASSHKLFIDLI